MIDVLLIRNGIKKQKKMKYKYLLLLFLMFFFVSGCNDLDDVNGIFIGKVWKLMYIIKKNEYKFYDFWGDKDKYE